MLFACLWTKLRSPVRSAIVKTTATFRARSSKDTGYPSKPFVIFDNENCR